jgi:hypothetical protein
MNGETEGVQEMGAIGIISKAGSTEDDCDTGIFGV